MQTQNVWSDEWNQWQASSRSLDTMRQIVQEVTPSIDDTWELEQYARRRHLTIPPPQSGRRFTLQAPLQQVLVDEDGCFWG